MSHTRSDKEHLMDENPVEQAQNEPVAEDSSVSTSPVEETTTSESTTDEGQADQAQIDEPAAEETNGDSERKPSRAERRINQLTDKLKQAQQSNQPLPGAAQPPQFPQYQPGEEITPERLQTDVVQVAQAIAGAVVEDRLAQQTANSNFETDKNVIEREYPEVTEIPELEQAIAEEFQARAFQVTGYNPQTGEPIYRVDPSVRLADIAKRHVGAARAVAQKSSADMKNAVAKSSDESAIKPGGAVRQDKPVDDMSIEEMEAKFGFAQRS